VVMKLSLLKYKTKSYLKGNKTLHSNLPYKQGINVGIIFSVEDKLKHDLIKDFIKKLEHDGKKVSVVSYLPKKKENYEFLFDFFTDEDLSFWGNINSASASSFTNTQFDFLFYLDTKPNPLILNIIAKSKAKCRVGKYEPECESYFELMIESGMSMQGLIDSTYKYTSQLR
jgi:hypothetical protein